MKMTRRGFVGTIGLGSGLCNTGRTLKIHGRDAHAVFEGPFRIASRGGIPTSRIVINPVIDCIEIVLAVSHLRTTGPLSRSSAGRYATGCPGEGC